MKTDQRAAMLAAYDSLPGIVYQTNRRVCSTALITRLSLHWVAFCGLRFSPTDSRSRKTSGRDQWFVGADGDWELMATCLGLQTGTREARLFLARGDCDRTVYAGSRGSRTRGCQDDRPGCSLPALRLVLITVVILAAPSEE